jgi:hypothetical protein
MADKGTSSRKKGLDADPIVKAQTESYVENQKKADLFKNISQYMFWGATTLMVGVIAAAFTGGASLPAWLAIGTGPGAVTTGALVYGGIASAVTFVGSLFFSNKGTEIAERGNVAYSDIDSKHQAHRMVQAFAKAQTQGQVAGDSTIPFTDNSSGQSWANRVGGNRSAAQSSGWADRIAAQAQAEEAQTLASLGRS